MAEEVGLLWWLGREPEATWEETGLEAATATETLC